MADMIVTERTDANQVAHGVAIEALEKCAAGFAALTKLLTGGPVYEGGKRVGMSALAVHSRAGEQCAREALSAAATAPDLRPALQNLLRAIDSNSGNEPSVSALERAIDEARAALRKAGVTDNG